MPLDLIVKKSKLLSYYFFIVIILSVIGIFTSSLEFFLQLVLLVLLIFVSRLVFVKSQNNKITRILLSSDDKWKIELNNNELFDAELDGECIVTYYITWLNFKVTNSFGRGKLFHLLLLPDSLDKNNLRKLRVRLRFLDNLEEQQETEVI
jgi:hypothetical protein